MAEPDLSKFAAAVRLRDRCTAAAVVHHERAGLAPSSQCARATYDAIAELVREDERRRLAAAGRASGPCCQDALDSDGNAHAEDCRYLAGVLFGRKQEAADLRPLIDDLTDPDACWYDHHGYCQAHGWMETDPRCPHARAKDVLAEGGEPNA